MRASSARAPDRDGSPVSGATPIAAIASVDRPGTARAASSGPIRDAHAANGARGESGSNAAAARQSPARQAKGARVGPSTAAPASASTARQASP